MGSSCTTDSMTVYYPQESVQKLQAQRRQNEQAQQCAMLSNTPPPVNTTPPPMTMIGSPFGRPPPPLSSPMLAPPNLMTAPNNKSNTSMIAPSSSSLDHSGFMTTTTTNGTTIIRGMSMNPFRTFPPALNQNGSANRKMRSRETSFGGGPYSELGESSFGAEAVSPTSNGFAVQLPPEVPAVPPAGTTTTVTANNITPTTAVTPPTGKVNTVLVGGGENGPIGPSCFNAAHSTSAPLPADAIHPVKSGMPSIPLDDAFSNGGGDQSQFRSQGVFESATFQDSNFDLQEASTPTHGAAPTQRRSLALAMIEQ
jgi:hypothetical protein